MTSITKWVQANTPESALIAALLTDIAAYLTGALTPRDAVIAALTALVTFVLAESHKDAADATVMAASVNAGASSDGTT